MTEDDPFETTVSSRLKRGLTADTSGAAANALFGDFVDSHSDEFQDLRESLQNFHQHGSGNRRDRRNAVLCSKWI
jgi:hypothetical protein